MPFLFFHLAKICQRNCCNRYDLFRSVAKIIAFARRDNLQVLQVCQMTSITSFEPLSPVVAPKFAAAHKRKHFLLFCKHSFTSELFMRNKKLEYFKTQSIGWSPMFSFPQEYFRQFHRTKPPKSEKIRMIYNYATGSKSLF